MPKIGKNHLIKKPKLVKTTTFATLLIAATLLFSSLAPAAMINNEENIIDTEPLNIGDDSGISNADTDDPEMVYQLEKTYLYEGSYRGVVVYDNGMFFDTICCSMEDTAYGLDCHQADDFVFAETTAVHDVHWVAGYWNGVTTPSSWELQFYEDDGGVPGDIYAGPFEIEWDDITRVLISGEYWEFSVAIDEVVFEGGQKYWLDLWGNLDVFPQCGWGAHYFSIIGSQALWGSDYFGFPYWTEGVVVLGLEHDMAFQLTQKPDHDVAATAILSPYSEQELCGCLPVSIEVSNLGIADEEDVPVSAEIRRGIFEDSFEDPIGMVWDTMGVDCGWSLTSWDSGNPSVVTPHTGMYMAEVNSGAGGMYGNCMLFEIDYENFEEFCNPWMSFYMWHDTYGSDDYLEVWVDPGTGVFEFVAGPFERLCCPGCPTGWIQHTVSLGAYAGLPFVRIAFKGYCDGNSQAYNMHIDTVEKFDQEFYAETTVDIAVGETVQVDFDEEWCPCLYGEVFDTYMDFEVIACTALDIDQNPDNDCISEMITIYFPFEIDVAAIEITEPVAADPGPYEMCGIIKNVGQTPQSCFKAKMNVHELGDLETIFFEDFAYACYPYYEWPPIGWTRDTTNWRARCYGGYTGSASGYPNAYFYWIPYGSTVTSRLITTPIDATGYVSLQIDFDHYLSHYGGGYTLSVEISTDLVEWTRVAEWENPTGWGATHETIETAVGAGEVFYLAFTFSDGNPYNLNYWDIDDITVGGITMGDSIWYDEVCVEYLDVCEELEVCFEDFVPPMPWPDCDTKKYAICLSVNPCDPIDQNPLNNEVCDVLEVEFYRDILVQSLSAPCPAIDKGDLMFEMTPELDSWSFGNCGPVYGPCYDDFEGLTAQIAEMRFTGLTAVPWTPCDPEGMEFEIIFYEGAYGGAPGDAVATYNLVAGSADLAVEATGLSYVGIPSYEWTAYFNPCVPAMEEGWVSIVSDDAGGCIFAWQNSYDGNLNAYRPGGPNGHDVAFSLWSGDCAGGSTAPPVDCFIPCGEGDICAIIENAGTHDEIIDIYYELWEWVTDPMVGTLVTSGTIDNVAIASGDTYEACFGTYDFAEPGVYGIIVQAPLAGDCDPGNNEDLYGIGVDCCPPHSGHYPDPMYPNGENNWYTRSVDVEIVAIDLPCPDPCLGTASGVAEIHYIVDSGSEVVVPGDSAEFKLTTDGVHLVEYWAVDVAGNVEDPFTFEIAIDKTAPSISLLYNVYQDEAGAWHVDFTAALGEATSGGNRVEFYIGSGLEKTDTEPPYDWSIDWIDDYKTVTFKAVGYDNAGNDGEDSVPGSEIAEEITAHSHAHQYIKSKTTNVIFNQQPRSR
jgi:hypothetical protein